MQKRKFDELISYFNRKVSDMSIDQKYKMELLGMISAIGFAHEKELGTNLAEVGTDCISRQAAIEAIDTYIDKFDAIDANFLDGLKTANKLMMQLPPAQLARIADSGKNDCVSRQAEIDALRDYLVGKRCPDDGTLTCRLIENEVINKLPPIQPEIVRCKDCKHWIPYDWMFSEVWRSKNMADYPEDEIGCNWCDMAMKADDFCSRAERREVTT